MERELIAIFLISETKRDFEYHFNSFKKLVDLENLKGVAQEYRFIKVLL